jgi:MSHA biogenesis protein MshP
MFHKLMVKNSILKKQKGSALVIAIFIIVVMTLLGSALVKIISSNAETIAYEVIGIRAFQAAQTGAQRKMSELFPLKPNAGNVCDNNPVTYSFITIKGLENCEAVKVKCSNDTVAPVNGISYYTITSTGQCTVAGISTSRKIEISARSM